MDKNEQILYEARAQILKALAHPTRLWLVDKLAAGEKCVCELAGNLEIDFSTVSKHLAVLKHAGIVEDEKRGKQVFYHLKAPCVLNFMHCVESVIQTRSQDQMTLLQILG